MSEPFWLDVARAYVGWTELPGPASNPAILQWAKEIGAPGYTNDDTPWCAVFANRIMRACRLPLSGAGYDLLRAKSFADWGQKLAHPVLGAVLVFKRPEGYHVGFYCGERADAYYVLGGNQGNAVSYAWIAKTRLVACRWPADVSVPPAAPTLLAHDGQPVSGNEA